MARTVRPVDTDALTASVAAYERAVSARRWRTLQALAALVVCVALSGWAAEVRPLTFYAKFGNALSYVDAIFRLDTGARVWTAPREWFWGLRKWLPLLGQTLLIAYVGTIAGAVIAFICCFFACTNLIRSRFVALAMRRMLDFNRTVPELVFALIFVYAFGLGPVPGVLAIAIHTIGTLGKLFAEVVENIDMRAVEGVAACGGSWVQQIRFAVLPQVRSNFLSYALLRFEINVRGATVMGFVGAGGIGDTLLISIRNFYYSDVSAILVMIIATVMCLDSVTEKLRHLLIGAERPA